MAVKDIKVQPLDGITIRIIGTMSEPVQDGVVSFIAAAPLERRASYSGSGLPFASQIQAFENTPNVGVAKLDKNNNFGFEIDTPNSYMVGLGSVKVPPVVYLTYFTLAGQKKMATVQVRESIAYRSLTYPTAPRPRKDATFYDTQFYLWPKTQEQIFYDSAYPCTGVEHANFWGLKPPQ